MKYVHSIKLGHWGFRNFNTISLLSFPFGDQGSFRDFYKLRLKVGEGTMTVEESRNQKVNLLHFWLNLHFPLRQRTRAWSVSYVGSGHGWSTELISQPIYEPSKLK